MGDIVGGLILFAVGSWFAWQAQEYSIGELSRMGSGYFPLVLGICLMGLGAGVAIEGKHSRTAVPSLPVRPLLAISSGVVAFGLIVGRGGLVPATVVLVGLVALAQDTYRPVRTILIAIFVAAVGYALFIWGLGLPLRAFWWS